MKFFGKIGFVRTEESDVKKGVWLPVTEEKDYYGDVTSDSRIWEQSDISSNDDIQVTNSISIVSDSYMTSNLGFMKYVVWNGVKWKIRSFKIRPPRVIIDFGGLYHEQREVQAEVPRGA